MTSPLSRRARWARAGGTSRTTGLAVFAAPEEIAPYAVGSVVFVIPYSELDGLLKPEYLPALSPKGGPDALSIGAGIEGAALSAVLDEGGVEFSLTASEEVRTFASAASPWTRTAAFTRSRPCCT